MSTFIASCVDSIVSWPAGRRTVVLWSLAVIAIQSNTISLEAKSTRKAISTDSAGSAKSFRSAQHCRAIAIDLARFSFILDVIGRSSIIFVRKTNTILAIVGPRAVALVITTDPTFAHGTSLAASTGSTVCIFPASCGFLTQIDGVLHLDIIGFDVFPWNSYTDSIHCELVAIH